MPKELKAYHTDRYYGTSVTAAISHEPSYGLTHHQDKVKLSISRRESYWTVKQIEDLCVALIRECRLLEQKALMDDTLVAKIKEA